MLLLANPLTVSRDAKLGAEGKQKALRSCARRPHSCCGRPTLSLSCLRTSLVTQEALKWRQRCLRSPIIGSAPSLIRAAGANSAVLPKNDGILPLSTSTPIELVGRSSTETLIFGGGSASLNAHYKISAKEGLSTSFATVHHAQESRPILLTQILRLAR